MQQTTFSINQACAHIGLGRTKVYQLIKTGELKARKIGARTIILQSDLDDFLKSLAPFPSNERGA
jgi:excisionase family DNA binding protein